MKLFEVICNGASTYIVAENFGKAEEIFKKEYDGWKIDSISLFSKSILV